MKKIMIMLGAVAMAACVQAASVQWATGKLYQANEDGSFKTAVANTTWATYDVVVNFYADNAGEMGAAIGGVTGNTDTSVSLGNFSGTTSDSFTAGNSYWAQVIVKATTKGESPVTYTMTSEAIKFEAPSTGDYPLNFTNAGAMPGTWDVPEPTSGLLLLLGVAGLALKRKRA